MGVVFPTRPTIETSLGSQVLQQGTSTGRPDPLVDRTVCGPLDIAFGQGVSEVRMRVINRHLRSYSVIAHGPGAPESAVEVDRFDFHARIPTRPPFPPLRLESDVALRRAAGEPDIHRVVVTPPADCFDLVVIDDLAYETVEPVRPADPVPPPPLRPNRFSVLRFEISQGAMPRLSPGSVRAPDTRLMALPDEKLAFVEGRDTAVRFFVHASERAEPFSAQLAISVAYRDGTTRSRMIGENVRSGSTAFRYEPDPFRMNQSLARNRARLSRSLDFVVPGSFLTNAQSMTLELLPDSVGPTLATINVDFIGPLSIGLNVVRVRGMGPASALGPAPTRGQTSLTGQFLEDIFPVSGSIRLRDFGTVTVALPGLTGRPAACGALLRRLDQLAVGTASASPVPNVNFWTRMNFVSNGPDNSCAGAGWLGQVGLFTMPIGAVAAHELAHNMGFVHASNAHGEANGGDWEAWPYLHGSIGTIDTGAGFHDGVYGVIMAPDTPLLDPLGDWGTWTLNIVVPCGGNPSSQWFPTCAATDSALEHDFMSYGPFTQIGFWGTNKWISDVNFTRVQSFLQDCIALSPPVNFNAGSLGAVNDSTGACSPAAGRTLAAGRTPSADSSARVLVFSGALDAQDRVTELDVVRKVAQQIPSSDPSSTYELVLRAGDGSLIARTSFGVLEAADAPDRAFVATVAATADPGSVEILNNEKVIFSEKLGDGAPTVEITSPSEGARWTGGIQRITWTPSAGSEAEAYVQYSPDNGASWRPLGLVPAAVGELEINADELDPAPKALLYVSVADGLRTAEATIVPFAISPEVGFEEDCIGFAPASLQVQKVGDGFKIVEGDQWLFDFGAKAREAEEALAVIKRFAMDQVCFIGRPDAEMTYFRSGSAAPGGSAAGLDCVAIDRPSLSILHEGDRWLLADSSSRVAAFASEADAASAREVIDNLGLDRQCFVGRPNPSFGYWLSGRS